MTGLALGCRLSAASRVQSLPARVKRILNKYGATMLLPGSAVPILGPERIVGNWSTPAGYDNAIAGNGQSVSVTAGTAVGARAAIALQPLEVGKTYRATARCLSQTATTGFYVREGSVPGSGTTTMSSPGLAAGGYYEATFAATRTDYNVLVSANVAASYAFADISVREVLGYQNTYSSFIAGNYRESTGQTLAAADQQVGLVVDAANGNSGAETIFNGDFATGNSGWSVTSGFSFTGGALTINASGGATTNNSGTPAVTGTLYYCEVVVSSFVSGQARLTIGGVNGVPLNAAGEFRFFITANTNAKPMIYCTSSGTSLVLSRVSAKAVSGIHASQSTSGFQPVLRRGLVNLFYPSEAYTGWTALDGASIGGSTATLSANWSSRVEKANSAIGANATGTAAVNIEGSGYVAVSVRENGGSYGVLATTEVELSNEQQLVVLHFNTSSISNVLVQIVARNVVCALGSARVGMFKGTVTAEEIIAAGGIPVTTSAPASSANGIQSWQFDGTDDRLSLSAVPFQMADDHFVVAGCRVDSLSSSRTLFSISNASNHQAPYIYFNASGFTCTWFDGAATRTRNSPAYTQSSNAVCSASRLGNAGKVRLDGVQIGTALDMSVLSSPATTVGSIGSFNNISQFFNGHIHGVIFGKGSISDSELLTLERFVASLQGRTL